MRQTPRQWRLCWRNHPTNWTLLTSWLCSERNFTVTQRDSYEQAWQKRLIYHLFRVTSPSLRPFRDNNAYFLPFVSVLPEKVLRESRDLDYFCIIFWRINDSRLYVPTLILVKGRDPDRKQLDLMLKEAPGSLNFTMFLMLFGEKVKGRRLRCQMNAVLTLYYYRLHVYLLNAIF